jgi:hypothetical protein
LPVNGGMKLFSKSVRQAKGAHCPDEASSGIYKGHDKKSALLLPDVEGRQRALGSLNKMVGEGSIAPGQLGSKGIQKEDHVAFQKEGELGVAFLYGEAFALARALKKKQELVLARAITV